MYDVTTVEELMGRCPESYEGRVSSALTNN